MKRFLVLWLLILFTPTLAFAQTASEEINRLKEHLEVAAKTVIKNETFSIPNQNPLKIYLATGLETQVKENFKRWIDSWNKNQSKVKKYGGLEVVNQFSEADVTLARRIDRDLPTTQYRSGSSGAIYQGYGRRHSGFDTGIIIGFPFPDAHPETVIPAYNYVLVRKNQEWGILYRLVGTTEFRQTKSSGKVLWNEFQKLLKKQN